MKNCIVAISSYNILAFQTEWESEKIMAMGCLTGSVGRACDFDLGVVGYSPTVSVEITLGGGR